MPSSKRDFERVMKETAAKTVSVKEPERKKQLPRTRFYLTKAWKKVRKSVLQRDRYCCVLCGKDVSGYKKSRVDHIIPLRERPELALDLTNLRTLCPSCDNRRHSEKARGVVKPSVNAEGFSQGWADALGKE